MLCFAQRGVKVDVARCDLPWLLVSMGGYAVLGQPGKNRTQGISFLKMCRIMGFAEMILAALGIAGLGASVKQVGDGRFLENHSACIPFRDQRTGVQSPVSRRSASRLSGPRRPRRISSGPGRKLIGRAGIRANTE